MDETTIDPRDLRPKVPRSGDRRAEPRRESDRALYYAEQTLLGVADLYVEAMTDPDESDEACTEALADLAAAVETYRAARDARNDDVFGSVGR